jgi:PAS domain S-box-containing protein
LLNRWASGKKQLNQAETVTRATVEKLRQREEQLRLITEASADGLWDWSIKTGLAELSPRYWEIIGHAPGEVVANREFFQRLVHPEDWPGVLASMTDHLAGKTADSRIEYRMITKEGMEKWIWGRGKVVERAADGSPLRMVGTISDITLSKQSELLLVKSEQRYRGLFENMNEGFALCRMINEDSEPKDFVFLAVNQMFATLTGLQDVVGKRVSEIIPGVREQDPELLELFEQVVKTGKPEKTERFLKSLQMWLSLAVYSTEPETCVVVFDVITTRKQVEMELAESNSLLNATLEATADGILVVDGHGKVVNFNQKFLQLWQIPASLVARKDDHQLVQYVLAQLAEPARFLAKVEELYHAPQATSWDELKFKDGRVFERYSQPQRLGDNSVGRVWSFRDVTKRRRAEEAQKHERNQLRTLIDHLPDMVYVRDQAGRFLIANQAFARRMGATTDGLIGKTDADFYAADAAAGFAANDRKVLAGSEILDHECTVDFPNGESLRIVSTKVPLKTPRGEVIGLVGVIHDITEQKRAEAARHENESLLRSILENSQEIIFVKDRECRFVFMNPAGYRLMRLTPEKLLGRSKADFHPNPAEVAKFMVDDRRVMESGQMETIEEEIGAADGTRHTFLTTKVPRRDSQGQVIGLIGVAHDITERKRAEQEIQRQAAFARFNPNPVLELSAAGEIKYFNAATVQMAGALGQKNPAELLPPNTAAIVRECLTTAKPRLRLETRAGNRTISWSFFPVEPSQSVHCYAGDITERKRAEAKLRESEEKFSRMFHSSPVVMSLTSLEDGRYLDVNEAFLHLLEKPREEVVGQRALDLGIWADAEQRAAVVAQLNAHGSVRNVVLQLRKKSDQIRQVLWSGEKVVIGGTICMLGSGLDITEQKQAEDALRESEERYRQLFELESDAIILVDCETHRYVDANLSALQLYGYSREEFLQLKPEDVSDEPERTRATIGTGSFHIPLRWHRKKNGERFAAEISANQINYRGRRTELATIRDISARQQVMDMLEETTAQLVEAQRIAGLGSYAFDVTTGLWTGSEVLSELFGIVDAGITQNMAGWLEIVHPQERAEMQRYLQDEVLKNRAAFDRTYRIIRLNDQQERWVHGLGKLVLDEQGRVVRMVGVIQDITERKHGERALLESQALYSSLVMQLPVGIFRKDPEQGRFVLVNAEFCQLKGMKPEDFLGKTPLEVLANESLQPESTRRANKYAAVGEDHHRQIMRNRPAH